MKKQAWKFSSKLNWNRRFQVLPPPTLPELKPKPKPKPKLVKKEG